MKALNYFILLLFLNLAYSQVKVGNNPTSVHPSAVFEVESTNKGLLLPRMSSLQRNSIPNASEGLLIFNTDTNCMQWHTGIRWYDACFGEQPNPARTGSTYTNFSNGTENFSSNTTCSTRLISAGHIASSCNGTVVTPNATYNVVLINGQCWLKENLKEPSTSPCANSINTGCNVWLNTSVNDNGYWGYYNTTTISGAAGWRTTEPAVTEGLLYQWRAAMNNASAERSKGVCPSGWHIPSDCEWKYLEHGLGMSISQQNL